MSNFSNYDKDVFLVKIDRMIDRGALLSRYSRASSTDIRDVYEKEFAGDEGKGQDFYRRVFLQYGDESIAELVTAQMAVQNVSNIVSKVMEELRVGLSFLEKSSRYVRYDKKVSGAYLFLHGEKAGITGRNREDYDAYCDSLFQYYASNYEKVLDFYRKKFPIGEILFDGSEGPSTFSDAGSEEKMILEKSYQSSVRARALDDLRYILPSSTLTNIGISGNGRAFTYLVQKLKSTGLPEAEKVADEIYSELSGEFPELINSALSGYGRELIEYKRKLDNPTQHLSGKEDANIPEIVLLDYEERKKALVKSLSIYNFSTGGEALPTQMMKLREMSLQDLGSVVAQLAGIRKNRRHKLHRAFESVSYLFQITTNYGAFRDMQRHRFISINRQFLTPLYGHDTPEAFMGDGEFPEIMRQGKELWRRISDSQGYAIAQYAVPYAFRYPVSAYLNLRELAFFCELRSTPQAHHDLRRIAIGMYDAVKGVHPELAALIRFVDSSSYALGRLRSEQAKEKKLRKLSER